MSPGSEEEGPPVTTWAPQTGSGGRRAVSRPTPPVGAMQLAFHRDQREEVVTEASRSFPEPRLIPDQKSQGAGTVGSQNEQNGA